MVILIGGVGYAGKTLMAQRLLERYKYPTLSIDHLKMGLYRGDPGCGFTPYDSVETIGEKLWPVLKGIIMTVIENKQHLIIEGGYLLPHRVLELETPYADHILAFYMGFSEDYVKQYYDTRILGYRKVIEARSYAEEDTAEDYIKGNIFIKEQCMRHHGTYFEIQEDYEAETGEVYAWIDKELSAMRAGE